MKAWRFDEFGDIANLQLTEAPEPQPGEGEALVKLEFAALNPADRFLVEGNYPTNLRPPFAVGRDGCGEIVESAGAFRPGDRVVILRSEVGVNREGTLAEFVTVPEESLAPLPGGWTAQEGAAGPLVLLTAWQAMVDEGELKPGQMVLVTGASGGVGTAAVQLGKALGARVVALSRSEEKRARLRELGAEFTFDSSDAGLVKRVKAALDGGGCDLVVENLGGPFLQRSLQLLAKHGRISVVGLLSGLMSEIQVALVIFKRARIAGIHVGDYTPAQSQAAWRHIVEALGRSGAKPVIDSVFRFDQVQEAFARMAQGPMGKVAVATRPSP